jgi:hypothetical protein
MELYQNLAEMWLTEMSVIVALEMFLKQKYVGLSLVGIGILIVTFSRRPAVPIMVND